MHRRSRARGGVLRRAPSRAPGARAGAGVTWPAQPLRALRNKPLGHSVNEGPAMAGTVDLRGRQLAPARVPVLADPTGRRARLLARAGRATAAVFVLWLAGLALAGLGILPAGDVPLGR